MILSLKSFEISTYKYGSGYTTRSGLLENFKNRIAYFTIVTS